MALQVGDVMALIRLAKQLYDYGWAAACDASELDFFLSVHKLGVTFPVRPSGLCEQVQGASDVHC